MKINNVGVNKVINLYNVNKKNIDKNPVKQTKDSIEISSVGKSLSSLSIEGGFGNSAEKIERLRNEVSKGTYKADSKLVASKMIDIMKEKGV
jgi:negative regulator of flagellin synthesis FlgM